MHLHGTVSTFTAQRRDSHNPPPPKKLACITISHATILYAVMHYSIIIVSSLKPKDKKHVMERGGNLQNLF